MSSRMARLAAGAFATALAVAGPGQSFADTIQKPAYEIIDLGAAEPKGITNGGLAYGIAAGKGFTAQAELSSAGTTATATGTMTAAGLGDGYSSVFGVNPAGQSVGQYQITTPDGVNLRAYTQQGGVTTQIPTLGGNYNGASAVNASGVVVGSSGTAAGQERGFVFDPSTGSVQQIGTFGGTSSDVRAINDAGQIAGSAQSTDGSWNAFIKTGDEMTPLGSVGGQNTWAFGINQSGQVAGFGDLPDGSNHAFLYSDGELKDLGTLGGRSSFATGINSQGQVVGWNVGLDGTNKAFWYDGQTLFDLNQFNPEGSAFAELTGASGINDDGQIVGWGNLVGGGQHAFVLNPVEGGDGIGPGSPPPVPEPSTIALFGLIALAGGARHIRRLARPARDS